VLETTRNGIELKNLRMRAEALASRLDFSERRVRALEGVVQYRPEAFRPRDRDRDRPRSRPDDAPVTDVQDPTLVPTGEGTPHQLTTGLSAAGEGRRRRRRRRGRRGAVDGAENLDRRRSADNPESGDTADESEGAEFSETSADGSEHASGSESSGRHTQFTQANDGAGDRAAAARPQETAPASDRPEVNPQAGGSDPDRQ
jgi:hypothetical protein